MDFQKSTRGVKCQNAKASCDAKRCWGKSEGAEQKSKVGMTVWREALSSSKAKSWKTKSTTRRKQRHQQLSSHDLSHTGRGMGAWVSQLESLLA